MSKSILKSKTAWLGFAVGLLPLIEYFAGTPFVTSNAYLVSGLGALIVALRFVTTKPVSLV